MAHGAETETPNRYSGRKFTTGELTLVREVVESCSGLSRTELARTFASCSDGSDRPARTQECREFLEQLESAATAAALHLAVRRPLH